MHLNVAHDFLPKSPTANASIVMDHFGVGFETGRHLVAENFFLPLQPGQIVAFTGPSGSGKSSLMRAASQQLENTLNIDSLPLGDRLLIDSLPLPVNDAVALLASCGLGEARLLLRTPHELSDGQRYRFRLALALSRKPNWIIADEFTAALDRTLAKVIAYNLRRHADRTAVGFLVATTHEDTLDDLAPDLHVRCQLNTAPALQLGNAPAQTAAQKKRASRSQINSNSRRVAGKTGRTFLGGIIAPTTSASSAG